MNINGDIMEENNSISVPFRPLGIVAEILEGMKIEITYAYEDLVFTGHNLYLLQFGEKGEDLYFIENEEATAEQLAGHFDALQTRFQEQGITLSPKGKFAASTSDEDELQLRFFP